MHTTPFLSVVDSRSYNAPGEPDRHPFAQLVLPVTGALHLEIDGHIGRLDPSCGALVAPGSWHAQWSNVANRSLVVDIAPGLLVHSDWDRLLEKRFNPIYATSRKLIEYLDLLLARGSVDAALVRGWLPLLLHSTSVAAPRERSRLAAMQANVAAQLDLPWTTARMARSAAMSTSRMHALFREELDTTPHAWLLAQRLTRACRYLDESDLGIAEIALATGFSEQSALTRAMRELRGITPAAYRSQLRHVTRQ